MTTTLPSPRVGVAIPAAGLGRRMGGVKKPWLELAGEPVLAHTLRPFLADSRTTAIVIALAPEDASVPPAWLREVDPRVSCVPGGASRAASVACAVAALPDDVEVILVHDAARPLVDADTIDRCVLAAASGVGAVAGMRAVDTLKQVEGTQVAGQHVAAQHVARQQVAAQHVENGAGGPRIVATPDRARFWHAQTPQGFPAELLRAAVARDDLFDAATDDASLVEAIGGTVIMVEGHPHNLKVTRPEDVPLADFHLRRAQQVES